MKGKFWLTGYGAFSNYSQKANANYTGVRDHFRNIVKFKYNGNAIPSFQWFMVIFYLKAIQFV